MLVAIARGDAGARDAFTLRPVRLGRFVAGEPHVFTFEDFLDTAIAVNL
jgi:hypothetical protein